MHLEKLVQELKRQVDTYKYVDVGVGAEDIYCSSREKLRQALKMLTSEGYHTTKVELENTTNPYRFMTTILSKNPIPQKDIDQNREKWRSDRISIANFKMNNDVCKNMFRFHANEFDPIIYKDDVMPIDMSSKKKELNLCYRLIGAMVRKGAISSEIENIVKYSMVVLSSEKKHLNWQKARAELLVDEMCEKYYLKGARNNET